MCIYAVYYIYYKRAHLKVVLYYSYISHNDGVCITLFNVYVYSGDILYALDVVSTL